MSVASDTFLAKVAPALDEAVRHLHPLEDPSWLLNCSGEVFRITLMRRRPNGTAWFEAVPVEVPGFNNGPHQVPSIVELRRRTAVALARAEGLKDELQKAEVAEILALYRELRNMSAAQLEGLACAYCGRPAYWEAQAMVPLKVLAGLEFTGAHRTLFVCEPDCRTPAEPTPSPFPSHLSHDGGAQ